MRSNIAIVFTTNMLFIIVAVDMQLTSKQGWLPIVVLLIIIYNNCDGESTSVSRQVSRILLAAKVRHLSTSAKNI